MHNSSRAFWCVFQYCAVEKGNQFGVCEYGDKKLFYMTSHRTPLLENIKDGCDSFSSIMIWRAYLQSPHMSVIHFPKICVKYPVNGKDNLFPLFLLGNMSILTLLKIKEVKHTNLFCVMYSSITCGCGLANKFFMYLSNEITLYNNSLHFHKKHNICQSR